MPKIYAYLANKVAAYHNCANSGNAEWLDKHRDDAESLVKERFPSGSGFDNGTALDIDESTADKLIFNTSFHHMDACGGYDGWTKHVVTVTPSLAFGFHIKVSGRNRNDIKEYIAGMFDEALDGVHIPA